MYIYTCTHRVYICKHVCEIGHTHTMCVHMFKGTGKTRKQGPSYATLSPLFIVRRQHPYSLLLLFVYFDLRSLSFVYYLQKLLKGGHLLY